MGCVLTLPNTPWIKTFARKINLDMAALNVDGEEEIFPRIAFIAYESGKSLGDILKKKRLSGPPNSRLPSLYLYNMLK
jgi:hypothetical protein